MRWNAPRVLVKAGPSIFLFVRQYLFCLLLLLFVPLLSSVLSAHAVMPHTVLLDEEFNEHAVNTALWNVEFHDNTSPHHQLQYFIPQDATLSNGSLLLWAERRLYGGRFYTSSTVTTAHKFVFTYGRIDIRAKILRGQGIKPALWLLGAKCTDANQCNNKWPEPGYEEIDIMESMGQQPNRIDMLNHYSLHLHNKAYQCRYYGSDFSQGYHTFSLLWEPRLLIWLIDGQQRCLSTIGVPSTPMFIVLETTVGGDFSGNPDKNTPFPANMAVDYIHVTS